MCGIAGVSELNAVTRRILPFLAYEMEERGDDSWGIMAPDYCHKEIGPITLGWQDGDVSVLDMFTDGLPVSLHTRAGSVGSIKKENSHPFYVQGSVCTVMGMHNGCVSNWKELEDKYKVKYEVDSHFICHFIANGLETKEIRGWGSFVWLQWENDENGKATGEPTLNFVRFNMADFHIAKLKDQDKATTLIWCSTKRALQKACNMADVDISFFYSTEGDTHYRYLKDREAEAVINKGYPLATMGKMSFGGRSSYQAHSGQCQNHGQYQNNAVALIAAKPTASDYEGNKNPIATGNVGTSAKTFSVGDIGKSSRVANKCVICKEPNVDRTNKALCPGCVKFLEDTISELKDPDTPITRKFLVFGVDWEFDADGDFKFIEVVENTNEEVAYGC